MSSINFHFTFDYSQPNDYHFSHDSVFLARRVFELLKDELHNELSILDLCSGCGIVGLDFLFHCRKELGVVPKRFDFLEIQDIYDSHFKTNFERLNMPNLNSQFYLQNYKLDLPETYDLILCNPPYFDPAANHLSPNTFKNRCRFFIDAKAHELIGAIEKALNVGGAAFVLARQPILTCQNMKAEIVEKIRGTALVKYVRTR